MTLLKIFNFPPLLLASYQLPVTNYQLPVTNYQLPVTNYQLPITSYQLPITSYQLPVTNCMFFTKKIKQQNIGQILKEARYQTGLSLKIISKHIHINYKYLEALEKNDWQKLPGKIYAKNFLKEYCQFLKISPSTAKDITSLTETDLISHKKIFTPKTKLLELINLPKTVKNLLLFLIATFFLIYIIWQVNQIIKPPIIEIFYPQNDLIVYDNSLTVSGQTGSEVKIKINQEEIILLPNNSFRQTINLIPGLNNLIIEGKTKYSRTNIIERKIIFEP